MSCTEDSIRIDDRNNLELVHIPMGTFLMGSKRGFPLELPVHPVQIKRPFLLGKFPVTRVVHTLILIKCFIGFVVEERAYLVF